jgi:DNA integrity scanning protein DisA with diadenylate cyclase activity
MYDENSFQSHIFWLKVKRIFLIIVLSIIGAIIGALLSQFVVDQTLKIVTIAVSTLVFFGISLVLSASTSRDIQEGYWKMAVLRKLTVISKKLDCLENLGTSSPQSVKTVKQTAKEIKKEIKKEIAKAPKKSKLEHEQLTIDDTKSETQV